MKPSKKKHASDKKGEGARIKGGLSNLRSSGLIAGGQIPGLSIATDSQIENGLYRLPEMHLLNMCGSSYSFSSPFTAKMNPEARDDDTLTVSRYFSHYLFWKLLLGGVSLFFSAKRTGIPQNQFFFFQILEISVLNLF
jgi:hypothetical protein